MLIRGLNSNVKTGPTGECQLVLFFEVHLLPERQSGVRHYGPGDHPAKPAALVYEPVQFVVAVVVPVVGIDERWALT